MFVTALANEDWLTEEPEVSARKNSKPKCRRLPNAVFDDWRLTLADLFLLIWRARHSDGWTSRPEQLKREHGFGPGLFHLCMNNLKRFGYIKRSQSRNPETGEWEYASEVLSREAAPAGRNGYSLLDTDIPAMPWRQAAMLGYLRSHASNFILSAKKIGKRFSLSSRQVHRIIKPLEKAGQVKLEIVRGERGRVTQKGYVAARESLPEPANSPCGHSPNAVPAMCGKSRAHNKAQPYTSLREISATAASKEAVSRRGFQGSRIKKLHFFR